MSAISSAAAASIHENNPLEVYENGLLQKYGNDLRAMNPNGVIIELAEFFKKTNSIPVSLVQLSFERIVKAAFQSSDTNSYDILRNSEIKAIENFMTLHPSQFIKLAGYDILRNSGIKAIEIFMTLHPSQFIKLAGVDDSLLQSMPQSLSERHLTNIRNSNITDMLWEIYSTFRFNYHNKDAPEIGQTCQKITDKTLDILRKISPPSSCVVFPIFSAMARSIFALWDCVTVPFISAARMPSVFSEQPPALSQKVASVSLSLLEAVKEDRQQNSKPAFPFASSSPSALSSSDLIQNPRMRKHDASPESVPSPQTESPPLKKIKS